MYLKYWGFDKLPFKNVPNPDCFYLSRPHEEALTRLAYAARMRKGGAMLSGEIGCGKTTLIKVYVKEYSEKHYDIGVVVNPRLGPHEFIQEILYQFGISEIPDSKVECLHLLNDKMMENREQNREMLLIIDEAQLLEESTFEEIRLLLNFQMNDRFLLTVILVGQPELKAKVKSIEQLDQRIAIRYHLTPFGISETNQYIHFRQKKAGRPENAFTPEGVKVIYKYTKGIPRKINDICDLALFIGSAQKAEEIGPQIIESIVRDGSLF